jgi:putative nucleotidyltransferase with HDIG domain
VQRLQALEAGPTVGAELARARPRLVRLLTRLQLAILQGESPTPAVKYSRSLVAFVAGTLLAGLAGASLFVRRPEDGVGVAIVSVAIFLLSVLSVRLVSGVQTVFTTSLFLHLGLALSAGPFGGLSAAVAESAGIQARHRVGAFRTAFNVPLIFLSNLVAWATFNAFGPLAHQGPMVAGLAGAATGIVHWAVNYGLLAGIVAVATRRSYWTQAREALSVAPYNVLYGYAAIGYVALHDRFGPMGFTFALAPVAALQVFMIVLSRRTRVHEEQRNHLLDQLREESIRVERSYDATLIALTHALDARDKETEGHSRRVVEYTRLVAVRLGIEGEELKLLCHGALLHDIGKIGVPDGILHKPGPLTEEEWQVMRRHPEIGALMVEEVEYLTEARRIILHHHERWDGRGYPLGLRGTQISLGARAFAIADTVDAITQDRPYRRGRSFDEAREEVLRCRGTQFDPDAVDAFLALPQEALLEIAAIRARVGLDLLAARDGSGGEPAREVALARA